MKHITVVTRQLTIQFNRLEKEGLFDSSTN